MIVGLKQYDLIEVGKMIPCIPGYCQRTYLWNLISYFLLSIVVSWSLQTCMMHKGAHNPSGQGNALVGHHILLF